MKSYLNNAWIGNSNGGDIPLNGELKTIPQLSRLLRLSQKQIRDYVAEGCPVAIPGKAPIPHQINTADFFHWCLAKRDADNRLKKKAGNGVVDEFRQRTQRANAEKAELELAMMQGELFYFCDLKPFVEDMNVEFRQAMLGLSRELRSEFGDELANAVHGATVQHLNAYGNRAAELPNKIEPAKPRGRKYARD